MQHLRYTSQRRRRTAKNLWIHRNPKYMRRPDPPRPHTDTSTETTPLKKRGEKKDSQVGQNRTRIFQAAYKRNLHSFPRFDITWSSPLCYRPMIYPLFQYTSNTHNPYPTAFPYGNGMVLHFYQQQESSTTKTVHKVINKRLKTYV